ncbi:hypothetical protein SapgrDRAFT_3137 [Saprospira grandis DSM 2844]|uniref:Uncharacterized protein n=1 Tax=Saprospira grandis DSM 2844 TaxID=694433 RepID=J0P4J4_9BACT|nr:hypothetical protein [Saprospira grandis]EJF54784.1 hypothetical protein SapgrDRAFT_3137 [Saprospira grandis DSM 2844]
MWLDILQITLPALLLFLSTLVLVNKFLKNQREAMQSFLLKEAEFRKIEGERRKIELQKANKETTLPLRLHAYERLSLYCNRLDIVDLLQRFDPDELSAKSYSAQLQIALEEEFSHNVTQQMYMSEELWQIILLAKKEAKVILQRVQQQLDAVAEGKQLPAQKYVEVLLVYLEESPQEGHVQALAAIKKEVALLF